MELKQETTYRFKRSGMKRSQFVRYLGTLPTEAGTFLEFERLSSYKGRPAADPCRYYVLPTEPFEVEEVGRG